MNDKVNLYRRNGKSVYIKQPSFKELAFVEYLWGHKETMADIGGVYSFKKDKWDMFYKKMVYPTDGKNFYCLIYTIDNVAIGEVSFHGYDSATKVARINIKIHIDYRGNGYGEEALRLLLEYYFLEFCGESLIDTITTKAAKKTFKKVGFEKFGRFREQTTYKVTKEMFLNSRIKKRRKVKVLAYDNMDIIEYMIPFKIFNKANEILKEELFEVTGVSYTGKSNLQYNISILSKVFNEDNEEKDILIIPGGATKEVCISNKIMMDYIFLNYNNCDYLLSFSTGIYFLLENHIIDGLSIPEIKEVKNELLENFGKDKIIKSNFVDNGKVVISSNIIGSIESCLNIINKVCGEEVYITLNKIFGIISK
ncbi:GNAT family N-acetyltransferase [Clostridium septicum]|uniref:GNAT family N-acetyltransferase n=1 Tax=Clostridium septicum TaxID=1504 RepID=A0A9N7JJB2_CLOSE|nr:GNAT family N-acetyltransferase [Clostridium septicum]AYE33325.1 GNAT family N-acetyltransferase [Clostridium septicum]MDU1314437.1 GNAT family N-acetyltransferase [Clostridium septicum]QAS61495.1 GNAT family N-acetyltransferase [Clostridium septicum]UEC22067.1 GNAT family N-acetyltransferase [Clostridium septicum]USR99901.1 GNAT family N-acetyltransferase [Clostridium septicum]